MPHRHDLPLPTRHGQHKPPPAQPIPAPAGPGAPIPDLIRTEPLLQLIEEANRDYRLLFVYSLKPGEEDWFAKYLAESETLSEFVRDRCVVRRVLQVEDAEEYDKVIRPLTERLHRPRGSIGVQLRPRRHGPLETIGKGLHVHRAARILEKSAEQRMWSKWKDGSEIKAAGWPWGTTDREKESDVQKKTRPLEILFEASFFLDKLACADQGWSMGHEKRAAARISTTHRLACELEDNLAAPIHEPARDLNAPGKPWRAAEFFARLDETKRLIRAGSLHDATGPCCWLWENWRLGPAELRPAVLFFITDLARQLAQSRPASRERFAQAREIALAWRHTGDYADRLSWYALNETLGDYDQAIQVLDLAIHGRDEGSMNTPADMSAYEIMLGRRWSDPWRYDAKSLAWFKRLSTQLDAKIPAAKRSAGNDDTLWEMFEEFRRQTWIADGCRLYAAALKADDAKTVGEVITLLLTRDSDGDIRRTLVATAIAAGVARPEHRDWLATSSGGLTKEIREALDLTLADLPNP